MQPAIEDNLNPRERIRLECVNQANMRLGQGISLPADRAIRELLVAADTILEYLETGAIPERTP